MFIQVKNYNVEAINKTNKGVQFIISNQNGENSTIEFDKLTEKVRVTFGKKFKMPKYLAAELLNLACSKGVLFLTEDQRKEIVGGK